MKITSPSKITSDINYNGLKPTKSLKLHPALEGFLPGIIQAGTYPLQTLAIRRLLNKTNIKNGFSGITFYGCTKVIKAMTTTWLFDTTNRVKWSENKTTQQGICGGITGAIEGIGLNPLDNIRNIKQASPQKKIPEIIKELEFSGLWRGTLLKVLRNSAFSFISMTVFSKITTPNDSWFSKVNAGGVSFLWAGILTTSLESWRVGKVFKTKPKSFSSASIAMVPAYVKVSIMGMTLGPALHKTMHNKKQVAYKSF
ncbi:hypothetical protein DID73_01285 [Candidatus Marinamargulisbacteria bacterium SCGC AG-343-K17]|nr:hypothetical protein DID73_01285 [Candidatus Marinamargulisbacteria bacterium SCGC AG-343-K17]